MDPICFLVAGAVLATLPAPEFTVAWQHSVQKTQWVEHYRVAGGDLVLTSARIEGSGAGMEPPPEAMLRDGWWSWQPNRILPELTLTRSSYVSDYVLCWEDRCGDLGDLVGATAEGAAVVVRPCKGMGPPAGLNRPPTVPARPPAAVPAR